MKRILAIASLLVAGMVTATRADEITVFAAASMTDALQTVAPMFAAASGHTVRFNFASSGMLARQIEEGAPADVFLSADEARMDRLDKAGLLLEGTRRTILSNTLVVITAAEDGVDFASAPDLARPIVRRIAIGDPTTVPAGTYARAYLVAVGQWDAVEPKLVPQANVRAVLAAVESGNVDAGFVYSTDAAISKRVRVVFSAPPPEGPRITYPVAVVREARHPAAAQAFATYLSGTEARAVIVRFGFGTAD